MSRHNLEGVRMFRRLVVSVLVGVTIAGVAPASPASAATIPGGALIQPGGAITKQAINNIGPTETLCTLGFILKRTSGTSEELAKRYTTISSHCGLSVGSRVKAPNIGYFGTIVVTTPRSPCCSQDTSLIEIDSDKLSKVSPVVKGYGAAPSGIATQAQIKIGDVVATYGYPQGTPATADQSVVRSTVVAWVNPGEQFGVAGTVTDLGAPFVNKGNGLAYGLGDDISFPGGVHSLHYVLPQIAGETGFSLTLSR